MVPTIPKSAGKISLDPAKPRHCRDFATRERTRHRSGLWPVAFANDARAIDSRNIGLRPVCPAEILSAVCVLLVFQQVDKPAGRTDWKSMFPAHDKSSASDPD